MEEKIIREHRRWTTWIEARWAFRPGNLVLTNRRLLFLHKISSSPEVTDNIKKLADAPMETVLNYAFTLNQNNFQFPLDSIMKIGVGIFEVVPLRFCLSITYANKERTHRRTVTFQFRAPNNKMSLKPQVFTVMSWVRSIRRAMKDAR